MGVFLDKSIKEVVDGLNVRYFLPDIQREYVWLQKADEKKIEQLFDSILRGYPIGSFLFWKLQKEDIAKRMNKIAINSISNSINSLQTTMSESPTMKKSVLKKSGVMICLLS
ncbi:hypothetical protein VN0045_13130 [Helicobacter pylori]